MAVVGYARTSTADQVAGLDDQVRELTAAGCAKVYSEHVSAFAPERPQLTACLAWLREGDALVITKPDRLARTVTDLLGLADGLRGRSVALRILSLDVDTSGASGRLTLTILAAVANWEREIMLERQRAGIARAKALGKYTGRVPVVSRRKPEIAEMIKDGLSDIQIADKLGCHRVTIYRLRAEILHDQLEPKPRQRIVLGSKS